MSPQSSAAIRTQIALSEKSERLADLREFLTANLMSSCVCAHSILFAQRFPHLYSRHGGTSSFPICTGPPGSNGDFPSARKDRPRVHGYLQSFAGSGRQAYLPEIQSRCRFTVPLASRHTATAQRAINLMRAGKHQIVPIQLEHGVQPPFGLEQIYSFMYCPGDALTPLRRSLDHFGYFSS